MKFLNHIFGKKSTEKYPEASFVCEPKTLYSPLKGTVISLEQVQDGVFSDGIMGPGVGILPDEGKLYAPLEGDVISVFETGHAIGIKSKDGIEVLMHIGIDTVQMNGDGFKTHVKEGDKVRVGDLLIEFDCKKIMAAGYQTVTMMVITNGESEGNMSKPHFGAVHVKDKLFYFI